MSLTERLLTLDKNEFDKKNTGSVKAQALSKLMGEPFMVQCREVDGKRMDELQGMFIDKNGQVDNARSRDIYALICCDGVIEPNLQDKKLQEKFGAASPKDLAKILFKGVDITNIGDKIAELSNYVDDEEKAKNA